MIGRWLSVLVMVGLLVTLMRIVMLLHGQKMSRGEYMSVRVPFSVYLGWISVATIANVTAWLVGLGWDGFGMSESAWTVVMLVVGTLIAVVTAVTKRDPFYVFVFMWAYFGILFNHVSASGYGAEYLEVVVAIVILMPVLITTAIQLVREHEHLLLPSTSRRS